MHYGNIRHYTTVRVEPACMNEKRGCRSRSEGAVSNWPNKTPPCGNALAITRGSNLEWPLLVQSSKSQEPAAPIGYNPLSTQVWGVLFPRGSCKSTGDPKSWDFCQARRWLDTFKRNSIVSLKMDKNMLLLKDNNLLSRSMNRHWSNCGVVTEELYNRSFFCGDPHRNGSTGMAAKNGCVSGILTGYTKRPHISRIGGDNLSNWCIEIIHETVGR